MPSLLAGDFGNLEKSARQARDAGADELHVDVMDAHFVHNLSMGPDVVKMASERIDIPVNVHLMMTRPDYYTGIFAKAGADTLTIHVESQCDVVSTLKEIRNLGMRPGVSINPETPVQLLLPVIEFVDEILFMSVHPGFGGQAFMPEVTSAILAAHVHLQHTLGQGRDWPDIAVDGGIDLKTAPIVCAAGANALIAGSSLYRSDDMARDIKLMREKGEAALLQK